MIPVFATIAEGGRQARRFARARPSLCAIAVAVYLASTALWLLALARSQIPNATVSYVASAVGWLGIPVLLAPVWTALNRFVVLQDRSRFYFPWDVRVRRVLVVGVLLAVLADCAGVLLPLAAQSPASLAGGRLVPLALLGAAGLAKLVGWWATARLATAPAFAAAGARQDAFDTSIAYTSGVALRIMSMKLCINLPWLALLGVVMPLIGRAIGAQPRVLVEPITIVVVGLVFVCTDFIEAATMASVAASLVRSRQVIRPQANTIFADAQPTKH